MSGDLIRRSEFEVVVLRDKSDEFAAGAMFILEMIDAAPAVEAEPVVHAHWEVVHGVLTPGGDPLLRCPRCKSRESEHLGGIECNRTHWNYCPHCGAHMDEEV